MSKKKKKSIKKKSVQRKKPVEDSLDLQEFIKYLQPLVIILGLTLICYFPSLNNEFVNWDDPIYVTDNPLIQSFSWQNIKTLFTEEVTYNYHPFTFLSLALNYSISGLDTGSYHLTNLVLHLANSVFVFFFVYLLFNKNIIVSFVTALLFAIHPMHVESVAWVTERKDLLYTFFFVPALIAYWYYLKEKETKCLFLSGVLFIFSLLSKPAAITLPFCLLLMDYWSHRKFTKKVILEKIPFFVLALLFAWITFHFQADSAVKSLAEYSIFERLISASAGYLIYLVKSLFPFNLKVFYSYPNFNALPPLYDLAIPIAVILTSAVFWLFKDKHFIIFGLLFFLLNISPVIQLVSVGGAMLSERYTYVPYIGLFFIYAILFDQLIRRYNNSVIKGLAAIYVLALCFLCWNRCQVWQNSETLWTNLIEQKDARVPSFAYGLRGKYYMDNKQLNKAISDFTQAIELKSNNILARISLGLIAFGANRHDEAISHYNIVLDTAPNNTTALTNRGGCYTALGQYENAVADLRKALEIDPTSVKSYINFGSTYGLMGNYDEAIKVFSEGLKIEPNNATLNLFLGYAYRDKGDTDKAQLYINKAKQLDLSIK